jgi:uncharacterized protein (DUF2384 family)
METQYPIVSKTVIAYAKQIFGTDQNLLQWFNKENTALNGKKPNDLLASERGCNELLEILARIEYNQDI